MQLPSLFGVQNRLAFQFHLVWSRIIFSRLTLAYFLFSVIHCIVQVALQGQALSVNSKAASVLFSLIHEKNATCNGFMVLGDTLRLCSDVPGKLEVDSCEQIWPVLSHSAGSSNSEPDTTSVLVSPSSVATATSDPFSSTTSNTSTQISAGSSNPSSSRRPTSNTPTTSQTTSRSDSVSSTASTFPSASTSTTDIRPTASPGDTQINTVEDSDSGDELESDSDGEDSVSGDSVSSDSDDDVALARRDIVQGDTEAEYFEDDNLMRELFEDDDFEKANSQQRRHRLDVSVASSAVTLPQPTGLSMSIVPKAAVTSSPASTTAGIDSDGGESLFGGSDASDNDTLSGESDNESLFGASDDDSVDGDDFDADSENGSVDDNASISEGSDIESFSDDSNDEPDTDNQLSSAFGVLSTTSAGNLGLQSLHHLARRQSQNNGSGVEGSETVDFDRTCLTALNYPLMMIRYTEREDVAFIVFQVWVLGMSTVALLNESVPHVLASLLTHVASTGWSAYKLASTASFHADFISFINDGACSSSSNILQDYWSVRTRAEIPTLILNVIFLAISGFMTWKLLKVFGWQTYKRMGASRSVNRLYMTILSLSIVIQLSLYFMAVTLVVWLDQLSHGDIAKLSTSKTIYRALFIVSVIILIPWLFTGWLAVRRDAKVPMLIFLMISIWFVGGWGALFFASAFQWTFITWRFFAVMASLSVFLTGSAFILALYCWKKFGRGLGSGSEFGAMGGDFAPVFPPVKDEEKIGFPSERPLPTYSGVFDIRKV